MDSNATSGFFMREARGIADMVDAKMAAADLIGSRHG